MGTERVTYTRPTLRGNDNKPVPSDAERNATGWGNRTFLRPEEPDEYGFRFLREVPRVWLGGKDGHFENVRIMVRS